MKPAEVIALPEELSASQRAALLNLLADEDPAIYRVVRHRILSCGPQTIPWLRPHALSGDAILRRRAREIVRHFERQAADNRFLAFCLKHGQEFDLEQAREGLIKQLKERLLLRPPPTGVPSTPPPEPRGVASAAL